MSKPETKTRVITPADIIAPPERPKPQVPDHELIRCIGRGAYGEVWLAKNVVGTYRAVKVVYRDTFKDERPYEREYRGIRKFEPISRSNDGFVDILQIGRSEELGHFYYVMELADAVQAEAQVRKGENGKTEISPAPLPPFSPAPGTIDAGTYTPKTLQGEIQQRGRLPFEECLRFALSLNLALGYLHRQGLIHRDIKPSNIIFIGGVPKLADIGLVTEVEEARTFVGTEGFIAPEGPNSPRADVYSLGKVLYEMSMGKDRLEFPEPFTALGQATGSQELEELNTVIVKACATDPRARYQNAEEMHVDLALLQSGKSVKSKRMLERRLSVARKAGAAVGAVAAVAVMAFLYQQFQTREARRLARENRDLASREGAERQRAEGLLNTMQLKEAEHFFESDDANKGVAYLSRMLRLNPSNHIAAARLMSALTDRSFALPLRIFKHDADCRGAEFSPDGQHIVSWTGGTNGVALIWDVATGKVVSPPMPHSNSVRKAQFSPDGRFVVTASKDGTARLWDAATGDPISPPLIPQPRSSNPAEVSVIRFSPDGKTLMTVVGTKVHFWQVPTGESVTKPINQGTKINYAELSPDGRRVLTTEDGLKMKLWDIATGELLRVWDGVFGVKSDMPSFSPDGSRVMAIAHANACIWDANTGERLHQLRHDGNVTSARFSPDGLRIVTGDWNRLARVWDAQTGQLLWTLIHKMEVLDARFDPTGERVLTREFWRARVWDSRTGRPLTEWMADAVGFAKFSPDGGQMLSLARDDKNLLLWDVLPGQALNVVLRHDVLIPVARFSLDGEKVVTASGGRIDYQRHFEYGSYQAATWDARTGELVASIPIHNYVRDAGFSPDGQRIVTVSGASEARIWDARTGVPVTEPLWQGTEVRSARFSPDGRRVVTGSKNKTARIWDAQTGQPLTDPQPFSNEVQAVEFSPDGRRVLIREKAAIIWDTHTGQVRRLKSTNTFPTDAQFSPDGQRVVAAYQRGPVLMWDSQTGEQIGKPLGHQYEVWCARFSPDGKRVVTASEDRNARVWDADTGKPLTEPMRHEGPVIFAQFSRDGRRVVTASTADHFARVWDAQTGRPLTEPLRHGDTVAYGEFSPDGSRVITTSADSTARIREFAPAEVPMPAWLLDLAEAVAGQRLLDQDVPENVYSADFLVLKQRLLRSPDTSRYTAWAKWFLADRFTRQTSLSSGIDGSKYLARLLQENSLQRLKRSSSEVIGASFAQRQSRRVPTRALREAVLLAPGNALATAKLARRILNQDTQDYAGNIQEGNFLADRAVKLDPNEPEAWRAKAEALEQAGRLDEAITAIERAMALDSRDPSLGILSGGWLEKAGRQEEALRAFSKAVESASGTNRSDNTEPPMGLRTALGHRAKLLARLGRFQESADDNVRARSIPDRHSQAPPALIDLSSHYNMSFEDEVEWVLFPALNNLASLRPGIEFLGGVRFDLRGAIRLGKPPASFGYTPKTDETILVDQRCERLHFLHAAYMLHLKTNGLFARYVVRYEDGAQETIPLVLGKTIGVTWHRAAADELIPVWKGANEASHFNGIPVQLHKLSWTNSRPKVRIANVGVEWLETTTGDPASDSMILVAITAQNEPTPTILTQPQAQTIVKGENAVFSVKATSDAPLAYQWQFNGAKILDATNATLSLHSVTREQAGTYTVRVQNVMENSVFVLTSDPATLVVQSNGLSYGGLRRERYLNIKGTNLVDLTNHARFPNSPDATDFVHQFETPYKADDKFGVRLSGYLVPPKTGEYRFYLSSNEEGALFLSTDESPEQKRQIAHEPVKGNERLWTIRYERPKQENISKPILLTAGRRYYVEALMKEDRGRDNLGVTWQMPGDPPPENLSPPIPGTFLAVPAMWTRVAVSPAPAGTGSE